MKNLRSAIISKFINAGIETQEASIEADIIINYVTKLTRKDLLLNPDITISSEDQVKINDLVDRRVNERIPVQYLTHKAYFMGEEFYVDENVLIPRPETELLVEETVKIILENFKNKEISLIDIGTGSGCIAIMLAKKLDNVRVTAVDVLEKALDVARNNAQQHMVDEKISFVKSDLFKEIEDKFDVIVSNPPYIPYSEKQSLQEEVVYHEPHLALFADDELGLDFYNSIITRSEKYLNEGGFLAFEMGLSQSEGVKTLLEMNNYKNIPIICDYQNIERIITAQKI